jgi:hypothetical protein
VDRRAALVGRHDTLNADDFALVAGMGAATQAVMRCRRWAA